MQICNFCSFSSSSKEEYKRHLRRKECIQSKSFLFVCKRCDFTGHSLSQIKLHLCEKMYYEHNIVETLRSTIYVPTLTTKAREEWIKLQKYLKQIGNVNVNKLNTKLEIEKCKTLGLNPFLIYGIKQYLKWLNPNSCDLGPLNLQNVKYWRSNISVANRYFNYTINRNIDCSHFFQLLLAKTECIFWPFLLTNDEIIKLVFHSTFCPIRKDAKGNFYILFTTEELHHVLHEHVYTKFVWKYTSKSDLYRFIHHEWIQHIFKHIIIYMEENNNIYNDLKKFILFWSDETKVLNCVLEKEIPENADGLFPNFEFNTLDISFQNLIKLYSKFGLTSFWNGFEQNEIGVEMSEK